jgi:5-methylcytosine-specific restriction endonuclease McrA
MPIRKDLRHFYRGKQYAATRGRIMERAKGLCERCGKRNHRHVWVVSGKDLCFAQVLTVSQQYGNAMLSQFWSPVKGDGQYWRSCVLLGATMRGLILRGKQWALARQIRVVLTMAHLNHISGDDRDENLKMLCQWCHLNYDRLHHHQTRSTRKDARRPILTEVA